jgi:transcriptional regulator with GAF, ATPase, and Fis domain
MNAAFSDLLASLTAIGHSLQGPFDPQRFLAEFSLRVAQFVPHDRLMISQVEEGGRLSIFAEHARKGPLLHAGRYTIEFDPGGRYAPEELDYLAPALAGEPMLVRDLQADPRFTVRPGVPPPRVVGEGLRSRLAVPLPSGGRIIGTLSATSYEPGLYSLDHLTALRHVADLIGPFIENIVLLHRERRRRSRLAALGGLACTLGGSLTIGEHVGPLADALRPYLDFDLLGVAVLGAGREVELAGPSDRGGALPRIPLDQVSFAARAERGEALIVPDAQTALDPRRPGDRALADLGVRSLLAVPLLICEHSEGVLLFAKRRPHWYDSADVEIATAIAAQLVVALQHQRLAEEQAHRARLQGRARQLEARLATLREERDRQYGFDRILGDDPRFREALLQAAKVAATETTVLLTGESGTGKELVARAIHHGSARAEGPYIAVNCAALPDSLVDAELFGHERGAFTGADKQKPGRFELAAGGTLFLDEVGELPPAVQAKLLRVLQEHEFQRVGGTATLRADVRLIAATNRNLERAVEAGAFREDLYYRLNVFRVHLPPLRERGDDVVRLAHHFVREIGARLGRGDPGLSRDAETVLRSYPWPGNIRELENAVERALILAEGGLLTQDLFGLGGIPPAHPAPSDARLADACALHTLADLEAHAIRAALAHTKNNKTHAAAVLGITRTQLRTRLKHLGVSPDDVGHPGTHASRPGE